MPSGGKIERILTQAEVEEMRMLRDRAERHWTYARLAKRFGVSKSVVWKWINTTKEAERRDTMNFRILELAKRRFNNQAIAKKVEKTLGYVGTVVARLRRQGKLPPKNTRGPTGTAREAPSTHGGQA